MQLRKLESHESSLHRDLRLRALHDSPDCFGETFQEVAERHSSYWDDLTRSVTDSGPDVMFLACEGELVLGSTYAMIDRNRNGAGRVGGMWVDPVWRKNGVGRALLLEVCVWARAHEMNRLGLWVPLHSPAAVSLYRQAGFQETGTSRSLPTNPLLQIIEMELQL